MQRKLPFLFILILLVAICVWAIVSHRHHVHPLHPQLTDTPNAQRVMVYFVKNKGTEIVSEPVVRAYQGAQAPSDKVLSDFALSELFHGPSDAEKQSGYFSEVPARTRILEILETPERLTVNLSPDYTAGGGSNSMVQRFQEVAKTLVGVAHQKSIYLQVNGKPLETLGGEGLSVDEPINHDPAIAQ